MRRRIVYNSQDELNELYARLRVIKRKINAIERKTNWGKSPLVRQSRALTLALKVMRDDDPRFDHFQEKLREVHRKLGALGARVAWRKKLAELPATPPAHYQAALKEYLEEEEKAQKKPERSLVDILRESKEQNGRIDGRK